MALAMSLVRTYWDGVEVLHTTAHQRALISFSLNPVSDRITVVDFENIWRKALYWENVDFKEMEDQQGWLKALTHGSLTFG